MMTYSILYAVEVEAEIFFFPVAPHSHQEAELPWILSWSCRIHFLVLAASVDLLEFSMCDFIL